MNLFAIGAEKNNAVHQVNPAQPHRPRSIGNNDVSLRSLSGIHRSGSDYVITPDTSAHTFDDFAAGEELMDLGRAAAEAALPEIKERVAKVYCSIDESASR